MNSNDGEITTEPHNISKDWRCFDLSKPRDGPPWDSEGFRNRIYALRERDERRQNKPLTLSSIYLSLSEYLGLSQRTVQSWASKGSKGPRSADITAKIDRYFGESHKSNNLDLFTLSRIFDLYQMLWFRFVLTETSDHDALMKAVRKFQVVLPSEIFSEFATVAEELLDNPQQDAEKLLSDLMLCYSPLH